MNALRRLALLAAVGLFAVFSPAVAQEWVPEPPEGYPERVLGDEDAPVTMIEYSSLTCPHCASFHEDTLPEIKKNYIDTGKVKLIYRDFPLEPVALGAAVMARCAPEGTYFRLLESLFATQSQWARAKNPMEALKGYGRLAGMNDETLQACFENEELLQQIQQVQKTAQETFGIKSTPSFAIAGRLHEGNRGYSYFSDVLDKELAAAGAN